MGFYVCDGYWEMLKEIMYWGRMLLDGIVKMYLENDY